MTKILIKTFDSSNVPNGAAQYFGKNIISFASNDTNPQSGLENLDWDTDNSGKGIMRILS